MPDKAPKKIIQLKHKDNTGVWTAVIGEVEGGWKVIAQISLYNDWPILKTEAEAETFLAQLTADANKKGFLNATQN